MPRTVNFNQSLNKWNVSNVRDMEAMFAGARSFNQPLNDWDVSNVKDMRGMFHPFTAYSPDGDVEIFATPFNQTLHAPWFSIHAPWSS